MIRTGAIFFLGTLLGLFIQASLIHGMFPSATVPDCILVLTVILARKDGSLYGLVGAFLLGLMADFASGLFLGPNAAGCVIAYLLVGMISRRVYADRALAMAGITFLCSIAKSIVYLGMLVMFVDDEIFPPNGVYLIMGEALLSGLVAPVFFKLILWRKGAAKSSRTSGTGSYRKYQESI